VAAIKLFLLVERGLEKNEETVGLDAEPPAASRTLLMTF